MTCRWIRDSEVPGGRYFLPGCIGGGINGPGGCTCSIQNRRKELEDKVASLEKRIKALEGAHKQRGT